MPKILATSRKGSRDDRSTHSYSSISNNSSSTTSSSDTRTLLTPNTSIGQHFLKNPAVVDNIG